jgi:hypothetical protein
MLQAAEIQKGVSATDEWHDKDLCRADDGGNIQ